MSWRRPWVKPSGEDLQAELESYIRIATDENIARGMDPAAARAAAIRKLGNRALIREEIYEMNTAGLMDALYRESRHALRLIRRNPGFSAIAILMLGIGVGATTAIFSVVNAVLIKPLSYPDPDALIVVHHSLRRDGTPRTLDFTPSMYFTYSSETKAFQNLGIWVDRSATITGNGDPEQVATLGVTNGVLAALGTQAVLGRRFSAEDDTPGSPETVMLAYGYWKRRLAADPAVIGRMLTVDSRPRQIVGVLPRDFGFLEKDWQLLLPLPLQRAGATLMDDFSYKGIARLKPGVTLQQADADVRRMIAIWMRSWTAPPGVARALQQGGLRPTLVPLKQEVTGDIAQTLWILMGSISLVLLIACANVATLLLARTESRRQELAIRAALGAGWRRIARELMIECTVLGLAGGALGISLAFTALRVLPALAPEKLPRIHEVSFNPATFSFALFASLLTSVVLGAFPVLKYAGRHVGPALQSGGRTASRGSEGNRARSLLVVVQVAGSLVLLIASGLMIRTMVALNHVQPGFKHPEQLQIVRVTMPHDLMPENRQVFANQEQILDRISAIPGVTAAALLTGPPLAPARMPATAFFDTAKVYKPGEFGSIYRINFTSPGALRVLGARLLAGRDFTWTELKENRPVALVSAAIAREQWETPAAAIGKHLRGGAQRAEREIIGVVADVYFDGVQQIPPPVVYWPLVMEGNFLQGIWRSPSFVVRTTRAGSQGLIAELRQAIWSVDRNSPIFDLRTLKEAWDIGLARTSFTLVLLTLAGAMALLLGLIGIYGMVAHAVIHRRREIGIRLALGARPHTVQWMFLARGLWLSAIGIGLGLGIALAMSRLITSLLFGVVALDPVTWTLMPIALLAATVAASYLPACRAVVVDPADTLRSD